MRIIGGKHKGRRVTAPSKLPIRPTTDMAKESLFNILNNHFYMNELRVLDLFAGMGTISLEFGSRGAQAIVSVDAHFGCVKFINQQADVFEMPITAIKSDAFKYIASHTMRYDVVFADPPYDLVIEKFKELRDTILQRELVEEGGMLIIEHSKHMDISDHELFFESRKYGSSTFSFFEFPVTDDEEE